MKCRYCGGEIPLEAAVCPYCGRPNEEARQHAEDMRHFRKEFQKTSDEVKEKAARAGKRSVRILISALLIAGGLVFIILGSHAYDFAYRARARKAEKNAAVNIEKAAEYLKNGEYAVFASFAHEKKISYTDAFEEYDYCYRMAYSYKNFEQDLIKIVFPGRYGAGSYALRNCTDDLHDFYRSLKADEYLWNREPNDLEKETAAALRKNVEALLVTYLGLTEEEAAGMEDLSEANRALLLERGLARYDGEEDSHE